MSILFPGGRPAALALTLALGWAASAAAQMPPPKPMVHSPAIVDCGPRPVADELCRLPVAFEADEAERRLAGADLAYWIEGDTLNIAARVQGEEAQIEGTIAEGMVPLSTRRPLWGAAYRLPGIQKSVIELRLKGAPERATLVWRGPQAPAAPPANAELKGRIEALELRSAALGGARTVKAYIPPGRAPSGGWPVVIAAMDQPIEPYAAIADALIARREVRPVAVLVLPTDEAGALRGRDAAAFARHGQFVRREALPQATKRFDLSTQTGQRLLFGIGPGADWALDAAAHDGNLATTVAAFSPPGLTEFPFRNTRLRLYLQAGYYEPPYLKGARSTCNLAGASGAPCRLDLTHSGHAPLIWQAEWAKVLKTVFPARGRR